MLAVIATLHILVAVSLILLVLVQDSKGGSGMFTGGGGSQSILGATGGATLFAKMTRIAAGVFAVTCVALTIYSANSSRSVIEDAVLPPPAATENAAPATETAPEAAPEKAE